MALVGSCGKFKEQLSFKLEGFVQGGEGTSARGFKFR